MSGWVNLQKFFFVSCVFTTLPGSLTYLLTTFSKDVWLSWPQIFFSCILLIYHFTGFPYLLTTFSKDVWLSWPKKLFLYLAYLQLYRISLNIPTTFPRMSASVHLKNLFPVSCSVDFRSRFWHWKWLPERVTHSSTSQQMFFHFSLNWHQNRVLTP